MPILSLNTAPALLTFSRCKAACALHLFKGSDIIDEVQKGLNPGTPTWDRPKRLAA